MLSTLPRLDSQRGQSLLKMPKCWHTGKPELRTHGLDVWTLDGWTLGLWTTGRWTSGLWTLGLWTTGRLDSGCLDAWTLDDWALDAWTQEFFSVFSVIYFFLLSI